MSRSFAFLLTVTLAPSALASPPFPGGILDSTGRTAYLASETGIDAVDLARGDLVWQSREAHRPLLIAGDRLYALALSHGNRLAVVAFDLAVWRPPVRHQVTVEHVFRTEVTDFPRWVSTRNTPTQSFHCTWRQLRNHLFLDWHADAQEGSGPAKQASGQVRIDLDSGRVESTPVALQAPRPSPGLPRQLDKQAVRWHARAGGQLLAVVTEELPESRPGARRERMVLRGWDSRTGKETAPRELVRGSRLVLLPDLDGKRLWLRDAGFSAGLAAESVRTGERRRWTVVSSLDGHLVARAPIVPGTQEATCLGNRAYCLAIGSIRPPGRVGTPRRALVLHALDLDTGKPLWRHSLGTPIN